MGFKYVVLGAGRQGTAAAYDLCAFGEASQVVLADADPRRAREAAARVKRLLKRTKAKVAGAAVDVEKPAQLARALRGADAVLSALPFRLNPAAAKAAVQAKTHYSDLGCHLETTRAVLKLDAAARKARVSLVPDCGLAPGLGTSLACCAMTVLDFTKDVRVYVGGLPQSRETPLGYKLVYSLDSLLALYREPALVLRRGRIEELRPLSEREELDFGPLGRLEACLTGGGTSTCPWSFQGRLTGFEYKTLRYPGHFEAMAAIRDMGFLDDTPIRLNGSEVRPRDIFSGLAATAWDLPKEEDLVVLRVWARGKKGGRPMEICYDLVDRQDPATGFTAMERTTGFSAAAVSRLQAGGKLRPGASPLESCLPHKEYLAEVRRRGLRVQESIRAVAST